MSFSHPGPGSLPNDCALLRKYIPSSDEDSDSDISSSSFEDDYQDDYNDRSRLVPNGARPMPNGQAGYGSTSRTVIPSHDIPRPSGKRRTSKPKLLPGERRIPAVILPTGEGLTLGQVGTPEQECVRDEVLPSEWEPWWKETRVLVAYTIPVATYVFHLARRSPPNSTAPAAPTFLNTPLLSPPSSPSVIYQRQPLPRPRLAR